MENTVILLIRYIGYEDKDVLGVFTSRDLAVSSFGEYIKARNHGYASPSGFPISEDDMKKDLNDRCIRKFKDGSNEVHYMGDEYYHLEYFTLDEKNW